MSLVLTLFTLCILHLLAPSHCRNTTMGEGDDVAMVMTTQDRNCTNSFSVLEDDLLSRETNRFNLLRTYYPARGALPVFVTVTYLFAESGNETVWYWSESEIYLIQPLNILQFTSLFHSNFDYRKDAITLYLSEECAVTEIEFLEILTQRLKLYAQTERVSTNSNPLRISDLYIATAASKEEIESDSFQSLFIRVWVHIVFILFPIATVMVIYTCDPIQLLLGDKTWQKLRDESNHPRLAAMIQISVVFTVYVFVIDCFSFVYTVRTDLYPEPTDSAFYLTTVTGVIVDVVAFLWVIFILATSCHWNCRNIIRGKFCEPITTTRIHKLLTSVTISPLLCSANHLPYVILSYISDPYHAGSISMGYFIMFLLFYFMFGQFYSRVALRTGSRPKDYPYAVNADLVHYPGGDACKRKVRVPFQTQVLLLSLVVVTPLVLFYEGLIVLLFWALPITKTLEDSPTRLYTIYQGTGILIVALLTYNIVLRPSPFSFVRMLDKLGKQMQIPEKLGRKWVRMGDEERAAVVIRRLYALKNIDAEAEEVQVPPLSPVLTSPDRGGGAYHHGFLQNVPLEVMSDSEATAQHKAQEAAEEVALEMESTN